MFSKQSIDTSRTAYGCSFGNCTFSVLVTQVDAGMLPSDDQETKQAYQSILGVEKAKKNNLFLSYESFEIGKITGMEVVKYVLRPGSDVRGKIYARAFFYQRVLFQITCFYIDGENNACEGNRKQFFQSLSFEK
jgi:hypothetical protein